MAIHANNEDRIQVIGACLNKHLPGPIRVTHLQAVSGGCINQTFKVTTNDTRIFFVKQNELSLYPGLLETEMKSLLYLNEHFPGVCPGVIGYHEASDQQVLILEWINSGHTTKTFWQHAGARLAAIHQLTNDQFGFLHDNYIGSLPQSNEPSGDWIAFFIQQRMLPQLSMAQRNNLVPPGMLKSIEKLLTRLPGIFQPEPPALVHGDLWNGNIMCNIHSHPVLIDPCIYFGHRLMDIGMTKLFGGFDKVFYEAYHYHYPLPGDYELQADICNLYPLLVHVNLFGSHYLQQVQDVLNKTA